jgi:hypothetical protein
MENPKLALIPSGYKSGKVYSILPTDGVGDFDFSRGSTATRVNKDGLIETVNNNVPRLDWLNRDCPSLLLEPQRTNGFTYSQDFSNSNWTKTEFTITSNQITAPNGTLTASELFETSASSGKFLHQNTNVATGNDYTISYFIKYQNKQYIQLTGSTGFDTLYVNYDILNGEIVRNLNNADASIEDFGNGWYRISLTLEATSTTNGRILLVGIRSANSFRAESYLGSISNSYYIWGGQMEQGSYPTSYIKTTGSTVTRLKDFIDGAGSSSLFNSLESTFFVEMASFLNAQTNSNGIELAGVGSQNRITLQYDPTNNQIRCDVRVLNSAQAIITTSSFDITNFNKMAITYKLNEVKFYVNGQLISTDTSVNAFAPNTLTEVRSTIADISSDAYNLQAKIKDLRVYNRVLTQEEAIELTTI